MRSPDRSGCETNGVARCLHLVVGAGREALEDCLPHVDPADTMLFLDCGVLHLLRLAAGSPGESTAAVMFAEKDLRAHGLLHLARRVQADTLDDAGFCELLETHQHCLTWT
jgi:sulfur relay protein TusB/DsrH